MNQYPLFFIYLPDSHSLCPEGMTRKPCFSWDSQSVARALSAPRSLFP